MSKRKKSGRAKKVPPLQTGKSPKIYGGIQTASPITTNNEVNKTKIPKVVKRSSTSKIMSFGKQKSHAKLMINKDEIDDDVVIKVDKATLQNLAIYLDWRYVKLGSNGKINVDLFNISTIIWEYCEMSKTCEYNVSLINGTKHTIELDKKPILVATSMKGDLVYCYKTQKGHVDYSDTTYHIVLLPKLDNIYLKGVSYIRCESNNMDCAWWEIENLNNPISHICFGRDHSIYFTNGEAIYQISRDASNNYKDDVDEIFAPTSDTQHITSLWRQFNEVYFLIQDWDTEDDIQIYKVKIFDFYGNNSKKKRKGSNASIGYNSGNDSPKTPSKRSRSRTSSRGDLSSPRGGGKVDFGPVSKLRNYTLTYNDRIWQLSSVYYHGKSLIGIGACKMGEALNMLNIKFKTKIKVLVFNKKLKCPISYNDQNKPHNIYFHRPTMSYFVTLIVNKGNNKKSLWIQFRLDKGGNKIVWHRTLNVPDNGKDITWLTYDDVRDCLIGFKNSDETKQEYILTYLPDMSKLLYCKDIPKLTKWEIENIKNVDKMNNPSKTPDSAAKVISKKAIESKSIWEHDKLQNEQNKQKQAEQMIEDVLNSLNNQNGGSQVKLTNNDTSNDNTSNNNSNSNTDNQVKPKPQANKAQASKPKPTTNNDEQKIKLKQAQDPFKVKVNVKAPKVPNNSKTKNSSNVDTTPTIKPSIKKKNSNSKAKRKNSKGKTNKNNNNSSNNSNGNATTKSEDTPMFKLLKSIKCDQYYKKFVDEGFKTLDELKSCTESDLNDMGVKLGHCKKILKALKK